MLLTQASDGTRIPQSVPTQNLDHKPGKTVHTFSIQSQSTGKAFRLANPHTQSTPSTSHYYHGNIHSYIAEVQQIPKLCMVQAKQYQPKIYITNQANRKHDFGAKTIYGKTISTGQPSYHANPEHKPLISL